MAFSGKNCRPKTFFIGATIENAMAREIYDQLNNHTLSNGAKLTNEDEVVSLCNWLIKILGKKRITKPRNWVRPPLIEEGFVLG